MKQELRLIYKKLYSYFGPQHWWPAETPFEVMVGAILTQSTSWRNVEKAITKIKKSGFLSARKLYKLPHQRLASLIKSAGYYNIKAKRLKYFLRFYLENYRGDVTKMSQTPTLILRKELLSIKGIGPETADSILLYALNKPIFVVDAYTKRILLRHRFVTDSFDYHQIQNLFMQNGNYAVKLYNEFHALLVQLGKDFCLKNKPRCNLCPLKSR